MTYRVLRRKWKSTKAMWVLMIAELLGTIPMLVLFGISQPDLYRTKLWQVGFDHGFNSNPKMILYAYANHQPLPNVPFVWSQMLTNFNVAISVVSLFILLAKMILFIMKVWFPLVGVFFSTGLVAIFATSVYGQMGPDYADDRYPSPVAWYIAKSCSYARAEKAEKSCMLAKGSFAITVFMLFLFLANLGLAVWSMIPSKKDNVKEVDDDDNNSPTDFKSDKVWEMQGLRSPTTPAVPRTPVVPRTPMSTFTHTPFTPRTQAFHTLDRKLPLRQG